MRCFGGSSGAAIARVGAALLAVAGVVVGVVPAPASAASPTRVEVVDLPSTAGNVDLSKARVNKITKLQARVVLPEGYDDAPGRRWPVLYLLHGGGGSSASWLDPKGGNLLVRAAGLPAIVVLPEGGQGYYTDHWLGGRRVGVNWERYELDEVVPTIESRYRVSAARGDHAIGGLSMGAFGTAQLAAQLPGYFGTAMMFSGVLDLERPETERLLAPLDGFSYTDQWGPFGGPYVRAHSPLRLLDNLRDTRLFVAAGNGQGDGKIPLDLYANTAGSIVEVYARLDALRFAGTAKSVGIDVETRIHTGLHSWPYWQRNLTEVLEWGPFARSADLPAAGRRSFTYRTMAPHGNAWGLGFRFSSLPDELMVLTRDRQKVSASGAGTVTITPGAAPSDATGSGTRSDCAFTATLPFSRVLPSGC